MLALQKQDAAAGVALVDVAEPPAPGQGEVLIEVVAAGICGSDLHIDDWAQGYEFLTPFLPVTLGHEFSGRVVAAGPGVHESAVGKRVVVRPSISCGVCIDCREGDPDECLHRRALGLHRPGAFAPRLLAPWNYCLPLPDSLDLELAALVEPLTISQHAVEDGEVKTGDRVLVFGPGTIGQGAAALARLAGAAEIVVVGYGDKERFEVLGRMGFSRLIDLADPGAAQQLEELAGDGFDVVIEAAGANSALASALRLTRVRGKIVAVGIHSRNIDVDVNLLVRKRLQLRGSYRASQAIWEKCIRILAQSPNEFAPMITHRLPLNEAPEGFRLGKQKTASKVILLPGLGAQS
ncbi:zinc-binding dehydrogenase [Bordetella sp. 15P40C-2]|uniref:zinc-dependent alcohol dehydrogenase n=1 Tax=Bordetella sp. 15P40C-2 TaxID=2572246 RepID=UPI001365F3AE|nr:alcohol dehydrogenase catalytic domain-containing protein [Bordetella sp. 15P40C-2]